MATEYGISYKNGGVWKNIPRPENVSPTIGWTLSEVDKNNVIWGYYETYNDNGSLGQGVYYTSDFENWQKPQNDVGTIIIEELTAIGDSVYALSRGYDGVFIVDTTKTDTTVGIRKLNLKEKNLVTVYPNPFTNQTTLSFEATKPSQVKLLVYNMLGQVVYEVPSQKIAAGNQQLTISLPENTKGIFLYSLYIDDKIFKGKLLHE